MINQLLPNEYASICAFAGILFAFLATITTLLQQKKLDYCLNPLILLGFRHFFILFFVFFSCRILSYVVYYI